MPTHFLASFDFDPQIRLSGCIAFILYYRPNDVWVTAPRLTVSTSSPTHLHGFSVIISLFERVRLHRLNFTKVLCKKFSADRVRPFKMTNVELISPVLTSSISRVLTSSISPVFTSSIPMLSGSCKCILVKCPRTTCH